MLNLIAIATCALLTGPDPTDHAPTEMTYLTREDALREFTIENATWVLQWSRDWQLNPDYSFLFTFHQHKIYLNNAFFRIYLKLKNGYALINELQSDAWFENMDVFWWTQPIPPKNKIPLIWIEERMSGTGHNTVEYLFTFAELPPAKDLEEVTNLHAVLPQVVQKVKYVFPPAPQEVKLKKGQGRWKGPFPHFGADGLYFTDYIYNEKDANCCPSGDKVSGTFKLVKEKLPEIKSYGPIKVEYAYRVETDSVRQAPQTSADN